MGRSIKSRLVALFVVAIASFGIFAGAAFAGSISSTHSWSSPPVGTCHAAITPAGYVANGSPISFWPGYFSCGQG